MNAPNPVLSRRRFVTTGLTAAGGPGHRRRRAPPAKAKTVTAGQRRGRPPAAREVNAWLVIEPDNSVLVRLAHSELGQGTATALAMLAAEELECDWSKVKVEYASANRNLREKNVYKSTCRRWAAAACAPRSSSCSRPAPAPAAGWSQRRRQPLGGRARRLPLRRRQGGADLEPARPFATTASPVRRRAPRSRSAVEPASQDARPVQAGRQVDAPARHPAQAERHGPVRHRRPGSRHGLRRRGLLPRVRRQAGLGRRDADRGPARRASRWSRCPTRSPWSPTATGAPSRRWTGCGTEWAPGPNATVDQRPARQGLSSTRCDGQMVAARNVGDVGKAFAAPGVKVGRRPL